MDMHAAGDWRAPMVSFRSQWAEGVTFNAPSCRPAPTRLGEVEQEQRIQRAAVVQQAPLQLCAGRSAKLLLLLQAQYVVAHPSFESPLAICYFCVRTSPAQPLLRMMPAGVLHTWVEEVGRATCS